MGAAIVDGQDLDIFVAEPSVRLLVLDPNVREVDLIVEVRQVVFRGPGANLVVSPIWVAVVVVAVAIVLVQPLLIVALQLIVEDDSIDARITFLQPLCDLQVAP